MAKGDDIEERLIDFAVRVVGLCSNLPRTQAGRRVGGQLLRSGTAPAAHRAEARGAESRRDFIHKLRICLKELNETRVWLKIVSRSQLFPEPRLRDILPSCDTLCRIINASIKPAQANQAQS